MLRFLNFNDNRFDLLPEIVRFDFLCLNHSDAFFVTDSTVSVYQQHYTFLFINEESKLMCVTLIFTNQEGTMKKSHSLFSECDLSKPVDHRDLIYIKDKKIHSNLNEIAKEYYHFLRIKNSIKEF